MLLGNGVEEAVDVLLALVAVAFGSTVDTPWLPTSTVTEPEVVVE